MKIAYAGFSTLGCKEELPNGCQGIRYTLRKACEELGHEFKNYFEEPDIFFFELNQIGAMNMSHVPIIKCCKMFKTAKKIILIIDDAHASQFVNTYVYTARSRRVPFLMKVEQKDTIKQVFDICDRIAAHEFSMVLPLYSEQPTGKNFEFYAKNIINLDYSAMHDYQNCYRSNPERKIVSYSYKKDMNLDSKANDVIRLSGMRELSCFQKLCENRVCYMTDYKDFVPTNWVRNRYAQAYNAKALIVGLRKSYFGDAYNISVQKYRSMSDEEFEEAVQQQRKIFEEKTATKEEYLEKVTQLLEI
ncbi:MAG: hypothetical protein IJ122_06490 [Methanobrevibacter sp.]|nr:hypothetical protein [Methanobrevibacter sp.]